jgi:hypothetical protein
MPESALFASIVRLHRRGALQQQCLHRREALDELLPTSTSAPIAVEKSLSCNERHIVLSCYHGPLRPRTTQHPELACLFEASFELVGSDHASCSTVHCAVEERHREKVCRRVREFAKVGALQHTLREHESALQLGERCMRLAQPPRNSSGRWFAGALRVRFGRKNTALSATN